MSNANNIQNIGATPAWYRANMGNGHQGLVVEETTGRNVAVTYEKEDAALIAAAPDMLEALQHIQGHWDAARGEGNEAYALDLAGCKMCKQLVRDAIAKAKE